MKATLIGRPAGGDGSRLLRDASFYAAAALVPLGIIAWLLHLWTADFSAPFVYGGDALATQAGIKGLLETGSWYTNSALGALRSNNLPPKTNFQGHNGFAAKIPRSPKWESAIDKAAKTS